MALVGIGGAIRTTTISATVWFYRETGVPVPFNGPFFGQLDTTGYDSCILGRDLIRHFALVIDRPGDAVFLLAGRHRYVIQET